MVLLVVKHFTYVIDVVLSLDWKLCSGIWYGGGFATFRLLLLMCSCAPEWSTRTTARLSVHWSVVPNSWLIKRFGTRTVSCQVLQADLTSTKSLSGTETSTMLPYCNLLHYCNVSSCKVMYYNHTLINVGVYKNMYSMWNQSTSILCHIN